jgi:hypothetical protein
MAFGAKYCYIDSSKAIKAAKAQTNRTRYVEVAKLCH